MQKPERLLFLPGASGSTSFWKPLAERLTVPGQRVIAGYPGFGGASPDPAITSLDDLVEQIVESIDRPTALIAQSMGGVIAMRAVLARPQFITHLVLSVTSGGVDMTALGAQDWRRDFAAANPHLPDWFLAFRSDLSHALPAVTQPTLLIWGDADPLSPVAVGERLCELLPNACLHVVPNGGHDLASLHAEALAPLVDAHLRNA